MKLRLDRAKIEMPIKTPEARSETRRMGSAPLAIDASFEEVDDGQARRRNRGKTAERQRVPVGLVGVGVDDDLPGEGSCELGYDEGARAHMRHPSPVQRGSHADDTPHERVRRHHARYPQGQGSAAEQFLGSDEHHEATDSRSGEPPAGDSSVRVQGIGRRRARDDKDVHESGAPLREGGEQARDVRQGLEHVSGSRPRSSPEPS